MAGQKEITSKQNLLDNTGRITEEGWARQPLWKYDRTKIKAPWFRIKEWDYYIILSENLKKGISFTISDLGYAGLMAVCWLDFDKGIYGQTDTLAILPKGEITNNADKTGIMEFNNKDLSLKYEVSGEKRLINFSVPFIAVGDQRTSLDGEILLIDKPERESINIATSWKENRKRFYYNRKVNCMDASGFAKLGNDVFDFNDPGDSGILDWGRGAWTYKNRWYWSSCSGLLNGVAFGFNLGYGFTDRTPASENAVFYNGKTHKLDKVFFEIDAEDYLKPWKFTSNDNRLELDFIPELDRQSEVNLLLISSVQHQVFGRFNGKIILDDGTILKLKDFLGFAEDVYNRY